MYEITEMIRQYGQGRCAPTSCTYYFVTNILIYITFFQSRMGIFLVKSHGHEQLKYQKVVNGGYKKKKK